MLCISCKSLMIVMGGKNALCKQSNLTLMRPLRLYMMLAAVIIFNQFSSGGAMVAELIEYKKRNKQYNI